MGDGVYKSTDAGKTWTHVGLDDTGRIGRILIASQRIPTSSMSARWAALPARSRSAASIAPPTAARHWDRVSVRRRKHRLLRLDHGRAQSARRCSPECGKWKCTPTARISGGPGSGVYISHDGGDHLEARRSRPVCRIRRVGKIDVAVAPTDSNRVYALIQTANQGSMWRSDDGGDNWRVVNWDRALIGRAGYYIHLAVSPANENEDLRLEQLVPRLARRRRNLPPGALGRRQSRHLVGLQPIPIAS